MQFLLASARRFFADLSLRPTIALALVVGLSLPIGLSVWRDLTDRRETLLTQLAGDHARFVEILAIGMQTPIWDIRPETGKPLIEVMMRDERVTNVKVTAPLMPDFLRAEAPERRGVRSITRETPVLRDGELIGSVSVEMSTARLDAEIAKQWRQVIFTGLVQLVLGVLILFPLLRYKVLAPLDRLVLQSQALAAGHLDQPLAWQRGDELGALGRAFENTRLSLRTLFVDLQARNREIQEREAELAKRSAELSATLDNMTDGITLVDADLRLVAWNRRLADVIEVPQDLVRRGAYLERLVAHDLMRRGVGLEEMERNLCRIRESFRGDAPTTFRHRTPGGRDIDVRRRPIPGGGFVSTYTDVTEQNEARRKVDETLTLLETVMDAVPAVLHVKDRARRYEMVNRGFLKAWDRSRSEIIGYSNFDLFGNTDYVINAERRDQEILESKRQLPFYEGVRPEPSGAEVATWTTKVPLLDDRGEVTHILTVSVDITERKRAEEERQRWLQLFRDAIESFPDGFAVFDSGRRLVICNDAFADFYDKPAAALAGVEIGDLLEPALARSKSIGGRPVDRDRPAAVRLLERLWAGEAGPLEVEFDDGRWRLISRNATAEGGFVFVRTDITDLKRMQQALSESEARFRSIAEAHPLPVVITRAKDGEILYASPATSQLWGAPQEKILGKPVVDYFIDAQEREIALATFHEQGYLDSYEVRHRRADGSEIPVALTSRPTVYDGAEAIVTGVFDLSERKAAERQIAKQRESLYQSEKLNALGTLLAGVAHELNNPLSVVVGQALFLRETAGDPQIQDRAKKIGNAADRCSRIVKTFLAMARQSPPQRTVVDLNDTVAAALEITTYTLRSADIEVGFELEPDLPPVWADPDQLSQVVMNLIVNAEQAVADQAPPRKLRLVSESDPARGVVRLRVIDNGPGIPVAIQPRIFEPFFTTKQVGVGTGVGLSVSHGIVEAHGGTLEVESKLGEGATFIVTLPRHEGAAVAAPESGGERAEGVSCRILVVDDEPDVSDMLADILLLDGHEVETAPSGNAAVALLGERTFDVVLSDLRMPDLDGPSLYRHIEAAFPRLKDRVAFVTGDALGSSMRRFLEKSGRPCLEKPFTPDEVRRMVQKVLDQAGAASA